MAACLALFAIPLPAAPWQGPVEVTGTRPRLVFACELTSQPLQALFSDPAVIAGLQELGAGVSLALIDLSADRAELVRRLNRAGVPAIAWMALPREQGYYLNAGNAAQAADRFSAFERWTAQYGLRWAAVGLDIEPDIQDFAVLLGGSRWRLFPTLASRYFDGARVARVRLAYSQLIRRMQGDGYVVQTYQFPFMADERKVHSTLLERLFGLVDVRGNEEVLMIYSSFNHAAGAAAVWKYGPDAQTIVVGVTSGDPADPRFVPLNWSELSNNLIVASHFTPVVGVYSLEGCVKRGFLARLKTMDWNRPVSISAASVARATRFRFVVQAVLWTGSRLPWLLGAMIAAAVGLIWRRARRLARSTSSAVKQ
jgi:hypothetical protein